MSDQLKDLRKLCIQNATGPDELYINACKQFAELHDYNRPRSGKKDNFFAHFKTAEDASKTMEGLRYIFHFRVNYANTRRPETSSTNFPNEPNDNRPYGICIKCGKHAYYNCERCGDFYCSTDCQSIDWLLHKLNCFPMPKLIPSKSLPFRKELEKSMESLKLNDPIMPKAASIQSNGRSVAAGTTVRDNQDANFLEKTSQRLCNGDVAAQSSTTVNNEVTSEKISNGSEVLITHVRSYQTAYIRSVAANDVYTKLLNDTAAAALTASHLKAYPCPKQDYVLAPYEGIYYRALVLSVNELIGSVRIAFIDFGNQEDVPFDTLKVFPNELKERPRLTLMIQLKNVRDDPDVKKALAMKHYLEEISELGMGLVLKANGNGSHIEKNDSVELIDMDSNQSITDRLNRL